MTGCRIARLARGPILLSLIPWLAAASANAEPVVTIRHNGPSANRINMVVLGDGYTDAELGRFATEVDLVIAYIFGQEPFASYAPYFNVRRVDVISTESGVDHPERGVTKDTALGAAYNCGNIQRLICINRAAVNEVLARSLEPLERDVVIVLANDTEYGASGGSIVVVSTHGGHGETLSHELGHTVGLLADEYDSSVGPTCQRSEPAAANLTLERAREAIKWAAWIESTTPLPTTAPRPGLVGLYALPAACPSAILHRPTFASKMRTHGAPFEAVNSEQLIRRFYNFVSPIERASPETADLVHTIGETVEFSVEPMAPATHSLERFWRVDGTLTSEEPVLRLDTSTLAAGDREIELEVRDPTSAVRSDPNLALVDRRHWKLTLRPRSED